MNLLLKFSCAITLAVLVPCAVAQEPGDVERCVRDHQRLLVGDWSRTGHGGVGSFEASVTRMAEQDGSFTRTESYRGTTSEITATPTGSAVIVIGHTTGPGGLVMAIETCERSALNGQFLEVRSFRGIYDGMANEYRGVVSSSSDRSINFLSARPAGTDKPFTPVYSHYDVRRQ